MREWKEATKRTRLGIECVVSCPAHLMVSNSYEYICKNANIKLTGNFCELLFHFLSTDAVRYNQFNEKEPCQ